MKISVLQSDIDMGIPQDCCSCPVAIAISRALGGEIVAVVGQFVMAARHGSVYQKRLPEKASKWIIDFDTGNLVAPIEFEL